MFDFSPSEAHRTLGLEISPAIVASARDLLASDASPWIAERTAHFFRTRALAQKRPLFVHKFTGWPKARFLHEVFPNARFVHLVRDGRAVANSLIQRKWWSGFAGPEAWGWGPLPAAYEAYWQRSDHSFVVLAAIEWMILMDAYRAAQAQIPADRWLEVHYEELLSDPRAVMKRIFSFLNLEWTVQYESRFRQYGIRSDRVDAYRRDLLASDVAWLDSVLSDHLADFGY